MFLPIPSALVCSASQDVDLAVLKSDSWQKRIIEAVQKAGYTITRSQRGKSLVGFIELELKHAEGSSLTLKLVEGFGGVPAEANLVLVQETPYTMEAARTRAAELAKKSPGYEIVATMPATGSSTARLSLRRIETNTSDPAAVVVGLDALRRLGREALATEPIDPAAERLREAKLIYSDIGSFYKLKYDYSDTKRQQSTYIRKEIYTYNSLKVQEIFSLCYDRPEPPSAELLLSAFQKRFSLGGLVLEAPSEKQTNWRIRFRVALASNVLPETLKEYILIVAGTADNLEKELNPNQEDKL